MSQPRPLWRWLAYAVGTLVFVTVVAMLVETQRQSSAEPRPLGRVEDIEALRERDDLNVLFVLIDTLRADRLGAYGYERDTSPTLDGIASTGVRFERHLAQSSWTKCSMSSLWTGLYPARNGNTRFDDVIPDEARLPAEIFRDAGFQTVGIYRNGWVAPTFGFHQGFEIYQRPVGHGIPAQVVRQNPTITQRGTDEDIVKTAVEFLRVNGHHRWFLYLHLMDVHEYTYDEESALFGGTYSDVYDNSIRWTDGVVRVLMEYLAAGGHLDDTLVVITSDHGEAFMERGFEGHARKVYRESTEVPLILSFPFRLEPGIVVGSRSRGVDVWPTVLDLVGLETPPDLDGRSLVPEILAFARGEAPALPPVTAVAHLDQSWGQRDDNPRPTVAVSEGPLRYVRVDQGHMHIEQLFDRTSDPGELRDVAAESPEALERLRMLAEDYLSAEPLYGEVPTKELSELELNQLRALGYALP